MKPQTANATLADVLDRYTVVGSLNHVEEDRIRCVACGHRCLIGDGKRGICKVRFNDAGQLKVPFGYVAGLQCDPVEKKPFFHVYPGSDALTFGMMGCDLHCSYCQNWVTSQALRDSAAVAPVRPVTPAQLVEIALRERARLVVSSYNEPLITAEWAVAVFEQARAAGLACAFVSNGNATPEVLDFLAPWICAYKVDLKSFDDRHYRDLGGTLDNILDTIHMIHRRGIWLEIVTLVIPGFNDSEDELREIARFLVSVSPDIPWHVTAFHKDYRMTDPDATPPRTLTRAAEIGTEAGLRYIYAGNLAGKVGAWENTRCPGCGDTLIERTGYLIRAYRVLPTGACPRCLTTLPGIWPAQTNAVRTGNDMTAYTQRFPRAVAIAPNNTALSPLSPVLRGEGLGVRGGSDRALPGSSPSPPTPRPRSTGGEGSLPLIRNQNGCAISGEAMTTDSTTTAVSNFQLDADDQERLMNTARAMVRAIVHGNDTASHETELAGFGTRMLAGAFVSLKRGKQLRSCCGMFGELVPLPVAIKEAATRTVWDDVRFPVVSPSEVDHLDLEVWLLHSPVPVPAKGEDRIGAITIGKHGIQVVRGQQRGLFLPSVATDSGWDAVQFLNQACLKAGLHATAWRDDATALYTFEGQVLRCRLGDGSTQPERRRSVFGLDDLARYAELCRGNIIALLSGATPSYFFPNVPDGDVTGLMLSLQGAGPTTHHMQMMLRGSLPLQTTLFKLCQTAAEMLVRRRPTLATINALGINIAILHDPVLHGSVQEHDLAGVDPAHRAILVVECNKNAMVFSPTKPVEEVVSEAVREGMVTQPAGASVFSLDVLSRVPFTLANVPRPVRGPAVRQPGAAGMFYPADADKLSAVVNDLLAGEAQPEPWAAAMLPHAGLAFSGRLAAQVLKRLRLPSTIIVIGPKHTPYGMDWAVAPHQTWAFPGGAIESDFMLARRLCEAIPGLEMDASAHQREHAIEVELPLLARLAPESRVIGLAIGAGDLQGCHRFAEGLANVMKDRDDRPLLLISSDMNHFAPDAENRRLDAIALDAIERLDPTSLYETVTQHHISMCGLLPAVIVMETLKLLGGLTRAERVGYATSADVTGDTSRVVGYAGVLLA
jgi:AmmeMemoRadiSam system radical SAM enzyme/AmmeMemoRadiSam system protein B/AmmeMemoRadiSam system protein A